MLAALLLSLLGAQAPSNAGSETLFERATSLVAEGETAAAIALLNQAVASDEVSGSSAHLARDLAALGHRLSALGRTEEAVAALGRAVEIWRSLDAPEAVVSSLHEMGVVLFTHSRLDEAYRRLDEARELARREGLPVARLESDLGMVLHAMGRAEQAMEHYERALSELTRAGEIVAAANTRGNIANLHLTAGRFPEAEAAYGQARAEFIEAGEIARATTTAVNLGMVLLAEGKYDEARAALEEGHQRARTEGWEQIQAAALLHLASVFEATGLFDRAEAAYRECLRLYRAKDSPRSEAAALRGLGALQLTWGRPDRASILAGEALALAEKHGVQDQVLSSLEIIGASHRAAGRPNASVLHYRRALDLARRLGRQADVSRFENALGATFLSWGKTTEAEKHFDGARIVALRLGQKHLLSQAHIHLGAARQLRGDPVGAREAYWRGLEISRSSGTSADEAVALGNLGTLALAAGDRQTAERHLLDSIALRERIRLTTPEEDRASALDAWISSYRWLVHLYFLDGNAKATFEAAERIRARHLAEAIGDRSAEIPGPGPDLDAVRRRLGPSEAIVSFVNVDWQHPVAVVVTRDAAKAYALEIGRLRKRLGLGGARGVTRAGEDMGLVVAEYRRLLTLVHPSASERRRRDRFARELHETLLGAADSTLAQVDHVVVLPEGSLSRLPFETLKLRDGRFLVLRHRVTYAPSLRVLQLLRERERPSRVQTLLAMGGVPHRPSGGGLTPTVPSAQMEALRAAARRRYESGKGVSEIYAALGLGPWVHLPGSREEVEAIGRIVPESTVLTGDAVSEGKLKALSRTGSLRDFAALHFATHGFTVAEAPELSALVLSEAGGEGGEEDGYLSLREIAALDIRPEFVALSSCESGLGTIYGGEGTIGLTQAFLEAGANGVAAALWQVHDQHAREFMLCLYSVIQSEGLSHAEAMTAVKRALIRQGKVEPVLWAPFVFYGT